MLNLSRQRGKLLKSKYLIISVIISLLLFLYIFFYVTGLTSKPFEAIKADYYWFKVLNGQWQEYRDKNLSLSFEYPVNSEWTIKTENISLYDNRGICSMFLGGQDTSCLNIGNTIYGFAFCTNPDPKKLERKLTSPEFEKGELITRNNQYIVLYCGGKDSNFNIGTNLIPQDKSFWIDIGYYYLSDNSKLENRLQEMVFQRVINSLKHI